MAMADRDSDKIDLAYDLKLVFDDRIYACKNRTIILE